MTQFLQQVVAGLASGSIYALLALGIVIIYRSTGIVNFAQGEMATFTTFIAWTLVDRGLSYWVAFALTLVITPGRDASVGCARAAAFLYRSAASVSAVAAFSSGAKLKKGTGLSGVGGPLVRSGSSAIL